mgnify:FL=1|jgi:hypothetical protein|tara:strand:- start:153 stop:434 length:282 start_codon:yes stop_codon:yes gene_type:complete
MSISRSTSFDGTIRTIKEKDGLISTAADATELTNANSNPTWRFRERLLKKIDRTDFDERIDYWRKQELAKKAVYADIDYMEKYKTINGSYPSS